MFQQTKPTLLAIGVAGMRSQTRALDIYTARTLREAIATIRLVSCDLLIVGFDNGKLDVWELIRRVLAAWPHQRWLLAARQVTAEEEVQARSLGALMVLADVPDEAWLADFAASLRRRDLSRSVRPLVSAKALASSSDGAALQVEMS